MTLEEMEIPYVVKLVDLVKGEQRTPEFLKISPNGRIPAIIDTDTGVSIFESGAIMMYLAEKSGRLMPIDLAGKYEVTQWLMFQTSGIGPMQGQAVTFVRYFPEKFPKSSTVTATNPGVYTKCWTAISNTERILPSNTALLISPIMPGFEVIIGPGLI